MIMFFIEEDDDPENQSPYFQTNFLGYGCIPSVTGGHVDNHYTPTNLDSDYRNFGVLGVQTIQGNVADRPNRASSFVFSLPSLHDPEASKGHDLSLRINSARGGDRSVCTVEASLHRRRPACVRRKIQPNIRPRP